MVYCRRPCSDRTRECILITRPRRGSRQCIEYLECVSTIGIAKIHYHIRRERTPITIGEKVGSIFLYGYRIKYPLSIPTHISCNLYSASPWARISHYWIAPYLIVVPEPSSRPLIRCIYSICIFFHSCVVDEIPCIGDLIVEVHIHRGGGGESSDISDSENNLYIDISCLMIWCNERCLISCSTLKEVCMGIVMKENLPSKSST